MRSIVLCLLIGVSLAGCSGSPEGGDATTSTTSSPTTTTTTSDTGTSDTTTTTTTTPPPAPRTWDLEVSDNSFPDGSIRIRVGDTVRWTHTGSNPHSVTADDGTFDSHPNCSFATSATGSCMTGGDTFEFTFTEAGAFGYVCRIHGSMTGTITVVA